MQVMPFDPYKDQAATALGSLSAESVQGLTAEMHRCEERLKFVRGQYYVDLQLGLGRWGVAGGVDVSKSPAEQLPPLKSVPGLIKVWQWACLVNNTGSAYSMIVSVCLQW